MSESAQRIGATLRALRKAAGFTRTDAARAARVGLRALDDDERGTSRNGVPCRRIDAYARIYGSTVSDVFASAAALETTTAEPGIAATNAR